ncbi:MAG: LrgB family protein [Candidatus Velthaea sp.]
MTQSSGFSHIWVYLEATPLLGLTLTLLAYLAADALWRRLHQPALLHPVLVAIFALVVLLRVTNTPYDKYFAGAQFVHFLLGPATVALAIPLYRNFALVKRSALAILVAITAGSLTSVISGVVIARVLGASEAVTRSLAPKSVTAPIAMGISEHIGGIPTLTAALVILTGITGAILAPFLFGPGKPDWPARGLAIGTAAHGIGTARALSLDTSAGAFASLALGLNAIASSLLVPLVAGMLFR